ncbi:hypothetical protein TGAM01_v209062 [Trichoderma gamsii]|uniref:Uncharacterized protein n=1 Tax=Trichoderma gamsii TaxID=398673 RepID=A0A2P4ZCG8_9HYPO|nr:hypothetical protein TGAM01_v209062 [Trichoderma gamsii]PON21992.1 hypothetical protein TGAM01_v209062 [Trichoderma gamsii]
MDAMWRYAPETPGTSSKHTGITPTADNSPQPWLLIVLYHSTAQQSSSSPQHYRSSYHHSDPQKLAHSDRLRGARQRNYPIWPRCLPDV